METTNNPMGCVKLCHNCLVFSSAYNLSVWSSPNSDRVVLTPGAPIPDSGLSSLDYLARYVERGPPHLPWKRGLSENLNT